MGLQSQLQPCSTSPFPKSNNRGIIRACLNQLVPSAGRGQELDCPVQGDSPMGGEGLPQPVESQLHVSLIYTVVISLVIVVGGENLTLLSVCTCVHTRACHILTHDFHVFE